MHGESLRHPVLAGAGVVVAVAAASALVWALETLGLADASAAYLLAVVAVAVWLGTWPALATSLGAFGAYNFLFTHPRFTFVVADSRQFLNLVLLLVVGVVVGQLAGTQRSRARAAEARAREARVLFEISRALATRSSRVALGEIAGTLEANAGVDAAWVSVGSPSGAERAVTDAPQGAPSPATAHHVLQRDETAHPARWMAVRPPGAAARDEHTARDAYRVPLEAAGRRFGSLWALRRRDAGPPGAAETRMLAAAADQVAQSLEQERLRAEATSAELARRSEHVKSALLESVSHDLRTPLAAIRAAAGTLIDGTPTAPADVSEAGQAIDDEAARMDRLVGNLLDASRIETGGVVVDLEPYELAELVAGTVRHVPGVDEADVRVEVPLKLPYVLADAVLLDQVLGNLVENALRHGSPPVRIAAAVFGAEVRVTVEDGGPGVPTDVLPRLFDKFYRVPGAAERGPRGVGLGLTVARGLMEAMGGSIQADASQLGGLAVTIGLPVADAPPDEMGGT